MIHTASPNFTSFDSSDLIFLTAMIVIIPIAWHFICKR